MEWPAERKARLRLARTESVGPVTFAGLLSRHGSAQRVLELWPQIIAKVGTRTSAPLASPAQIDSELAQVQKLGARHVILGDSDYPALLARMGDPPPVLTVQGRIELLGMPALAVVGARTASAASLELARRLARELGQAGLVIVSGLARGVDGAAHQASLPTGTIAVLAGGVDYIYPPEHDRLHVDIATQGLLVSERKPGLAPIARDFPRRNRIVAGLALGTLVVEAAAKSGSLITARLAGEFGREVLACPGSPMDSRTKGSNDLIRHGAALVETAQDVLDALAGPLRAGLSEPDGNEYAQARTMIEDDISPRQLERLFELLSPVPVSLDLLARHAQMPLPVVMAGVVELELGGRAQTHAGGQVSSAPSTKD